MRILHRKDLQQVHSLTRNHDTGVLVRELLCTFRLTGWFVPIEGSRTNPRTTLYGPFPLTNSSIDDNVVPNSPGVFALGYSSGGEFVLGYLDRADANLRTALQAHLSGAFPQFKFAYAISPEDAFRRQCEIYHGHVNPQNGAHPHPPRDTEWLCPSCKVWRRHQSFGSR